jgi:DNA-directed RNA polymerase specialized sigma24 family protein
MPPDDRLPPELRELSKTELRELYVTAMRIALGLMKSRSAAEQLVSDAFEALLTTRRWDKSKGPLERHLFGVLTSIRSNRFKSKADARAEDVGKEYQREMGEVAQSAEARMLSHSASEADRSSAGDELDELARSVAHLPVATKVLGCLRASEDGEKKKPAEVAAELGLPREEVYMANKLLREHLAKIRARRGEGGGEE